MTTKIRSWAVRSILLLAGIVACNCGTSRDTKDMDLLSMLPSDTRGILSVKLDELLASDSAPYVAALLNAEGNSEPALSQLFGAIAKLSEHIDLAGCMERAILVQTTDAEDGLFLLAKMSRQTIEEVISGPSSSYDWTQAGNQKIVVDANGNNLTMLSGGVLVIGKQSAVLSVLEVVDGVSPANASNIAPSIDTLDVDSVFGFVYGLPAMFNRALKPDDSLRGATLVSGSLTFTGSDISGSVSFHTSNASDFVDAYNTLNSASEDEPLVLGEPNVDGLGQVVVSIPATPINKSHEELINSRNTFKKLFPVMEAYNYAEDVADPGNKPFLDLVVKSAEDGDGSPGSVFVRWEFKDSAAIRAFETNELPAGFRLAPCQFLEADTPGYFLALNLYNAGGGSIVQGARAEWDIFVQPPNGDVRPRFMVIDALAEAISADAVHGLTPGEPLSHEFVGNRVVTSVAKIIDGVESPIFSLSFPKPIRTSFNIARFTREMAIGNDYIYWGHGVYDRVLYNASTFNYDALLVNVNRVRVSDKSHWAQYLNQRPTYVVYYTNTLEYVAAPWDNLDSPYLDISPEWLDELYQFKNNGNYLTMMRDAVRGSFKGQKDALVPFVVENIIPTTFYNFQITDHEAMSAALKLPPGYHLAKTRFLESSSTEDYYLTLTLTEIKDSVEGARAQWSVYVDDGRGREHMMVIGLQTQDAAIDPVRLINLPSKVSHKLADSLLRTSVASRDIEFDASFDTKGSSPATLSLDWIEAGELVCHLDGICDKLYYDAETLDTPVHIPTNVTIETLQTPWNALINTTPTIVFYRNNLQEYVVKRWHNLKLPVEEPTQDPVPIGDASHVISGTGSLIGRTNSAVDSTYVYSGSANLEDDQLVFIIDQQIENALGEGHIISSGSFDLTTGIGMATVEECIGPALVCAGVDPLIGTPEATSDYIAQNLDASDRKHITWDVTFTMDIPGGFGEADSSSSLSAIAVE